MFTGKIPVLSIYIERPRRNSAKIVDLIWKLFDASCEEVRYVFNIRCVRFDGQDWSTLLSVFQRASEDVTLHRYIKLGRVSVLVAIHAFSCRMNPRQAGF